VITEQMLRRIRRNQLLFMPQKSIIRRWVGIGGGERERKIVAEDVPTRFTPGWGRFINVADRLQGITPYTITVPWDTDLKPGDEVIDEQSRTFHIRDAKKPSSYLTAIQALGDLVND